MPVPATVQVVLAARIDRLPPEEKRLLQTATVIGTDVPFALLRAVADMPEAELHRGLAHLQAAEFLYETHLFPEQEYTFTHALTHEVAYGSLLLERRRGLHARLVEALEALALDRVAEGASGRSPDQVERLAQHALRGQVWDKAVTYCQQAGARAWDRAAFREAVTYCEQALQAFAHLPEDDDTQRLAIDCRLALERPVAALGEDRRRLALLGEAEALARALDDRARLGGVLVRMSNALRDTGDDNGAIAASQQALALAVALGDSALQALASLQLGTSYYFPGDFGRAAELLRQSVEAADRGSGTPSTDTRIRSRARLAMTLSEVGAFTEGRRYGEEALRLATLEGRGVTPLIASGHLGHLYLAQGDLEHAIRVLEQGLALCRASGERSNMDGLLFITSRLGYAYALQGRIAEGRALLEETISEDIIRRCQRHVWLSEVYRLAGHGEESWQHACQGLDCARQLKEMNTEARALHQLGVLHTHAAPPRCRAGRGVLPAGPGPGRETGHAPARGPLPLWPRHAVCHDRSAGACPC
jgi:tetratricopeptide (TPR) repeat protein